MCGTDTIFDGYCFTAKEAPLLQSFPDFEFVFQGSDGTDVQLNVPASSYMMEQDGSYCWAQGQTTGVNAVRSAPPPSTLREHRCVRVG